MDKKVTEMKRRFTVMLHLQTQKESTTNLFRISFQWQWKVKHQLSILRTYRRYVFIKCGMIRSSVGTERGWEKSVSGMGLGTNLCVDRWGFWFIPCQRHIGQLSSAASTTLSQLMPIFLRSFLTTSFQFCHGRPGLLLKPSGSRVRACHGSLWWSIRERCSSHLGHLHLIMSSSFGSAVASLTFSFQVICYFVLPGNPEDTSLKIRR